MKFQLFAKYEPDGDFFKLGPEIESLEGARGFIKFMDWLWVTDQLPPQFSKYSEYTEIQARQGERIWEYADQDPSGLSDGVWFE